MRPTFATEPRRREAGLTLLEMLVVVSILALVVVAVPGFFADGPPRHEATMRALRALLVESRAEALRSARPVAVTFDLEARAVTGAGKPVALPESLTLDVLSAAEAARPGGPARIVFFPDGSATGGAVRLSGEGRLGEIRVRWLTGGLEVDG